MRTVLTLTVVAVLSVPAADPTKWTVKAVTAPPPKEVREAIRSLLTDQALQVVDEQGKLVGEFWLRKEVPVKASAADLKKGLAYRDIEQTTLFGVVRFPNGWSDFRKQKVKPGVYTLRLAFQPMDGDHMGTAPFNEFLLLSPAAVDVKPDLMEFKALFEMSCKAAAGSHAAILLLYPNDTPAPQPQLAAKEGNLLVLNTRAQLSADGQKADLGLGLVVEGKTTAE
ncbi:MAG: hypothetical protein NZ700_14300 [Gemmataceae bacterium]|nr:hypothetical protein [Gemmataceae bacterium]MDW8264327.1 hypothetical protein [Gemmataceae bacterium]